MAEVTQVQMDEVPCENPECDNQAVEPEQDGDHLYYECEQCGFAFGWKKVEEGTRIEGNCAVGVPESIRRAASAPMEKAQRQAAPVNLGLTIGKRPGLE